MWMIPKWGHGNCQSHKDDNNPQGCLGHWLCQGQVFPDPLLLNSIQEYWSHWIICLLITEISCPNFSWPNSAQIFSRKSWDRIFLSCLQSGVLSCLFRCTVMSSQVYCHMWSSVLSCLVNSTVMFSHVYCHVMSCVRQSFGKKSWDRIFLCTVSR